MYVPIVTETLQLDARGLPYSSRYDDRYACAAGAWGQAQHVFLGGTGLPGRWSGRKQFVIVETGFGLGVNFLAVWEAWRRDPQRPCRLHYISCELHPVSRADIAGVAQGSDAPAAAATLRGLLAQRWPEPVSGLHRLEFEAGALSLSLVLGNARAVLDQVVAGADAFFLDGFAPDRNPALWEEATLRAIARLARPGAGLASYTCAGAVRRGLAAQGFAVHKAPGYGAKRAMSCAQYAPAWRMRRYEPAAAYSGTAHACVVGAGLAGCASALALVRRGWQVTLVDSAPAVAQGASALPAGLLAPSLSADDNRASQLSRQAYLYALAQLQELGAAARGTVWRDCGVLHALNPAAAADARVLAAYARARLPPSYAQVLDAAQASAVLGASAPHGGVWFPRGALVNAAAWCRAMVDAARQHAAIYGGKLDLRFGHAVVDLSQSTGAWTVYGAQGPIACAPVLVLANAMGVAQLCPELGATLQAVAGRLSLLRPPALAAWRAALRGDGYLVPPLLGAAAVGASYETLTEHDDAAASAAAAQASNRARFQRLTGDTDTLRVERDFHAVRCTARDHQPLAGCLPDDAGVQRERTRLRGAQLRDLPRRAGLYCLTALASRGITLAPLLAEQVAAQICGEPWPLLRPLGDAVDPGRFALRALRVGKAAANGPSG